MIYFTKTSKKKNIHDKETKSINNSMLIGNKENTNRLPDSKNDNSDHYPQNHYLPLNHHYHHRQQHRLHSFYWHFY